MRPRRSSRSAGFLVNGHRADVRSGQSRCTQSLTRALLSQALPGVVHPVFLDAHAARMPRCRHQRVGIREMRPEAFSLRFQAWECSFIPLAQYA